MKPELHRLQPDPPEGDPAVIDRELARQEKKEGNETARDILSGQAKQPGEGPSSDERAAEPLKHGAEEDSGQPASSAGETETDAHRAMDDVAPQTGVRPGP